MSNDNIFLAAPAILRDLEKAGVEYPALELFADGSGKLKLGAQVNLTDEQIKLAVELVHSERFETCIACVKGMKHDKESHNVSIQFCGGLFAEAQKRGLATVAVETVTPQWEYECAKGHRMMYIADAAPESIICLGDYCDLPMRCTGPWREDSTVYLKNDVSNVGEIG